MLIRPQRKGLMKMKHLEKTYEIEAPLEAVFAALTEEERIAIWSGSPTKMELHENGQFALWDGGIHGIIREITNNRIVQQWKEKKWSNYSIVQFELKENGGLTILNLTHENIPDQSFASIRDGWDQYYLGPLKEFCEKK